VTAARRDAARALAPERAPVPRNTVIPDAAVPERTPVPETLLAPSQDSLGLGTGLSGGATPVIDGVVLSLARFMRILGIDPQARTARVQPGVRGAPVYLIGAMDKDKLWRLKPQNLIAGLPLLAEHLS
jgi:hypothetical protein